MVEHGGDPLGDRLGAAPELLHVAGGGRRSGVADEVCDVLQRLVAVHEQRRDDGPTPGVRPEVGVIPAVFASCLIGFAIVGRSTSPPIGVVNTRLADSPS